MLTMGSVGRMNAEGTGRDDRLNLIFYTRNADAFSLAQGAIAGLASQVRVEFFRNLEAFSERLRMPSYQSTVAVIVAADRRDLEDISTLGQLLWGTRVILVLPDGDDSTIALAHSLRPRLVSKPGNDLGDVIAVLRKMIEDHNSKSKML